MSVQEQIDRYIADQSPAKCDEMRELNQLVVKISPGCKLWFLDSKNEDGKIVSNPNIGYGSQDIKYADGKTKEFYQIGLSANTTGISIYLMGAKDKTYLSEKYGKKLGKANVTGYCVKFRTLSDTDIDVLGEIIADHMNNGSARGS